MGALRINGETINFDALTAFCIEFAFLRASQLGLGCNDERLASQERTDWKLGADRRDLLLHTTDPLKAGLGQLRIVCDRGRPTGFASNARGCCGLRNSSTRLRSHGSIRDRHRLCVSE